VSLSETEAGRTDELAEADFFGHEVARDASRRFGTQRVVRIKFLAAHFRQDRPRRGYSARRQGAITSAIATCFRFTCCTRRPRANAGNIFVPCQCALRWSSRTFYGPIFDKRPAARVKSRSDWRDLCRFCVNKKKEEKKKKKAKDSRMTKGGAASHSLFNLVSVALDIYLRGMLMLIKIL